MALTNLNNVHFSATTITEANNSLTDLEHTLAGTNIKLTAEERQRYGSIHEQNKLFVNKVYDYNKSQPSLSTTEVDWKEFNSDHESRLNLEKIITRLENLTIKLKNAKTLHDFDNFQAALIDYAYTNFMAGTGAAGFETKQAELKQFFTKAAPKNTPAED